MFPYASLTYVCLFYFWDSWLVFQVDFGQVSAAVLFGVWSTLNQRNFPPSWCMSFPRKCNLTKLMRWKKWHTFSMLPLLFFLECVRELPVMSGFCFFNVQCYFGTIFTIYSPLMYYEWIHEIVGWWHHFPKKCSRHLWESMTFNGALLSFWTTLYSLLERRD